MESPINKPGFTLARKLIAAGADAGRQALESGHKQLSESAIAYKDRVRIANPDAATEELVKRVCKAHVALARSEGAGAGVVTTGAEIGTILETAGIGTVPAMLVITVGDLTMLAWIQLRMTSIIAALYGHDPTDRTRLREFAILQGALPVVDVPAAAGFAGKGAIKVLQRLTMRYLRGPALVAIKSMFRTVGIKFSRAAVLRQLPLVNVPINATVNDLVTRRLAQKASDFYRTLPSSGAAARRSS